ncbi:hypothetical protein B0H15DRAFT_950840 [Mycena belliarum]|uniref:F-box domain-containing protein n=1 Tax=Mycena belliarum TaxID=1033014 RepID=A0AAD6U0C5_9AGAR|nr:hypothetical protein B0H15DRAFT_950840 [Mycena belliae]
MNYQFLPESSSYHPNPSLIGNHCNLRVIVQSFPMELWGEIFWFYIAPTRNALDKGFPDKGSGNPNPVLPLSQVCRYWRQAAHSTPNLWTELSIRVDHPGDAALIKAWLGRSFYLPLSLVLFSDSSDAANPDFTIMDIILPERNRLASLEILMPLNYSTLAPIFAEPLNALHTLRFIATLPTYRSVSTVMGISGEKVDLSVLAPHLRNATFHPDFDWDNFFSNVPWSQMAQLHFPVSHDDAFSILQQCTSLRRLCIHTNRWEVEDQNMATALSQSQAFTLPHLRHFDLVLEASTVEVGVIVPFFHALTFPALSKLGINFQWETTFWDAGAFAEFQARSPNVQHVDIVGGALTSAQVISLLRSSPALKTLALGSCTEYMTNEFLGALQYRESDAEPLAPRLEVLSCIDWGHIQTIVDESALEDMIRSRWWPVGESHPSSRVARLGKLSIRWSPNHPMSDAFIARMRDCIQDGNIIF